MNSEAPRGAMRLRILHICPRPSFSGLEAYALAMAQGQSELGHDVTVAVLRASPLAQRCLQASLKTRVIDDDFMGHLRFAWQAIRLLGSAARPDIVHLHSTQDLDLMLPALLAARTARPRTRAILQTHIWISHSKRDPLHAFSYSLIDELWCSSQRARETLEKFIPIPAQKIRVINYGRDVRAMEANFVSREEARRKLDLPLQAQVVGTVARIDEGKGTRELLEAALRSMAVHPLLHVILIGPPTADDPRAIAYAAELSERVRALPPALRERVHMPGAVADSYRYLKAFDLYALATYNECFALSLLEAQLAGVPCLATRSGGSPEVVREGETGWLMDPRSVESLHQTLERALDEVAQWPLLAARARERVRREFDFTKILPATIDAYRRVIP